MNTLVAYVVIATITFFSAHEYWVRQARDYEEIECRRILGDHAFRFLRCFGLLVRFS
jgi:hypothetical protein